jgi:peptidoglycan/LPS O-acetylase OafA/YrhL
VEEKFYVFWPLLILFTRRRHHPIIIAGTLLVGISFEIATANVPFAVFTTPACLSSFAIGAGLAYLHFNQWSIKGGKVLFPLFAAVLLLVTVAINLRIIDSHHLHFAFKLAASPLILLVIYQIAKGEMGAVLQKLLANRVIVYLGRISYGLYLYHNLVTAWPTGNPYTELLQKAALLLGVASLSYYCVEKPLLALKNKV